MSQKIEIKPIEEKNVELELHNEDLDNNNVTRSFQITSLRVTRDLEEIERAFQLKSDIKKYHKTMMRVNEKFKKSEDPIVELKEVPPRNPHCFEKCRKIYKDIEDNNRDRIAREQNSRRRALLLNGLPNNHRERMKRQIEREKQLRRKEINNLY